MSKHRMLLSLDDELYEILMELSKVSGAAASSFVAELLEESKPQLIGLIKTIKLAKKSPQKALDAINEALTQQMNKGTQTQLNIIEDKKKLRPKLRKRKMPKK